MWNGICSVSFFSFVLLLSISLKWNIHYWLLCDIRDSFEYIMEVWIFIFEVGCHVIDVWIFDLVTRRFAYSFSFRVNKIGYFCWCDVMNDDDSISLGIGNINCFLFLHSYKYYWEFWLMCFYARWLIYIFRCNWRIVMLMIMFQGY